MGRFGQSMVPFTQLKMAETIGKGTTDLYIMNRHKQKYEAFYITMLANCFSPVTKKIIWREKREKSCGVALYL